MLAAASGAPLSSWSPGAGSSHYNGMIAPLKYLSLRGALFAHGGGAGEVDASGVGAYGADLKAVVASWRALMPVGDFGFHLAGVAFVLST